MKLYLDNSVLNRPFDDQRQPRIWLETLCFILILQMIEKGDAQMVSSAFHFVENDENPVQQKQQWVEACLNLAAPPIAVTEQVRRKATLLASKGVAVLDSLHLAAAEAANVDYFVTCDDKLIRRYSGPIRALTPAELVLILTQEKS